jgi:hypothetical protein
MVLLKAEEACLCIEFVQDLDRCMCCACGWNAPGCSYFQSAKLIALQCGAYLIGRALVEVA